MVETVDNHSVPGRCLKAVFSSLEECRWIADLHCRFPREAIKTTGYMSHHQSKGDRSDAQLKRAGRASDIGFARAGGVLSIPAKGGGPGPSKRVSAVAAVTPQPASSVSPKARTSTLAAFTNPGGRRANGLTAPGRGPSVGGSSEPGDSNMLRLPVSTQRQSSLQQQDATNAIQHPQIGSVCQSLEVRKTMEGGLAKSSASSSGSGVLSESIQPTTTASYEVSQSTHVPLSFQFGSFDPSFESFTTGKPLSMPYPLRTNSAPPNIDEQQREQARFERPSPRVSAPAHGKQQQIQVASTNMGTPVTDFSPAMVQHIQANVNSQALSNVPLTAQATPQAQATQQQLAQAQYTQQHTQAANVHIPAPHLLQLAQMQQAMAQQQQQHQAMPQQQGIVQQGLTQAMKYAQPMMAPPPHGPQVLGTHIGSSLANQLSAQQILPQMAHSIGPNLASGMGGQLSQSMQGSQYGAPSTNQFLPQRVSRAIKIVDPHTHEELRFEVKRGDCLKEIKPMTSGSGTPGLVGRLSTNGAAQRPPAGYNPSPSHQMVPGSMAFYGHPYSHPPPSFFQSVPPKAVAPAGGPPSNNSAVRFSYAGPLPGQVVPFVGHPGSACPKGSPQLGPMPQLSSALPEVYNKPPMAPTVITPIVVPSATLAGIPAVMANSRPSSIGSCPMPLVGNNHLSMLNRRPAGLPASTSGLLAPCLTLPPLAFKFGDLDASDSSLVDAGQAIIESSLVTTNGQASISPPNLGALATINMSVISTPVANCKFTAASPKPCTSSLSTGAVNLKPPSTADRGSSGLLGEIVKVETVKTLGIQNSRKNTKKDRQRQQQHHPSPHLITPTLQVFEGQSDKYSSQLAPSTVLTSMEDLSLDGPSAIAASLQVLRAGMHDAQSGAEVTVTLHAPSISTSIQELPKMRSEVTFMGHETTSFLETPHTEDAGEFVGKEERELLAQQIVLADANEPWDLGSPTGHECASISISDKFGSSSDSSFSKDKVSKGKECALCERNVLVHANFTTGTSASSCPGCKCVTGAIGQVEVDLNDFRGKQSIAEEGFSASVQDEERGKDGDVTYRNERLDSELDSKLDSTVPGSQVLEEESALVLKPIEGMVTPDSFLENDEGGDQGVLAALQMEGGDTGHSTVSSLVSLNTGVGPSFKVGDTELSFVKDFTGGKTSNGGAEVLDETDEADKCLSENDLASDRIDRQSDALLDNYSCEVEESAIQILSLSTDTVEGTPKSGVKAVELSDPPVTELMPVVSGDQQDDFMELTTPGIPDDLFILKSNTCLRSLGNLRSTESAPTGCEDVSALSFEEISSVIERTPLLSSPLGEISVAVHITENGTETLEPTSMGHANLAMEGLKGASKKKKKKEFLARADAAGNTADLYNAYKAAPEKKLEGVKQIDESGPGLLNSDVKDCVAVPQNSLLKEVDDWEDAAELPTPSVSFGQPLDRGDRKYTRDFLMTFKDQNQHLPPNFEIRHEIIQDHLFSPAIYGSGVLDVIPSPGRIGDRQPNSGGPRLDRRGLVVQHGPNEDRWTRQSGLVPSPGRNQLGDVRMDMCMPVGFRPGQTNTQPGLISHLSSPVWPGMVSPQTGFTGLISRGPGNTMLPHFMAPVPSRANLNGVDGDRWHRQPMVGSGMISSSRSPLPAIHKAENRYEVGKVSDEESAKQRLIKGILNKLTPQNFEKLFAQVQAASIDSAETLTGVISQIFDKALMEPTFCEMYAQFCVKLAADLPEFAENDEKFTFKRVLLNKCQVEFERGEREQEEAEKIENEGEVKLTPEEREEKRLKARRRMLGNIRFIGELYKKSMLTERIMHECIKKLLGEFYNPDEEDVEALCKLMSTIGRIIDHPKAKEHIDQYFRRIEGLSNNMKLSSRLRFMLKDVIDLRQNGWQERRKVEGPKKIDEVHRDAVQERQQAARGDRRGPSMGGAPARVRIGPSPEFAMRSSQLPGFSPNQIGAGAALGGMRRAPSPQGAMQGGGGSFVQDVRMEDRSLVDIRSVPLPLTQKATDDGYITLGPQGNLGRALGIRQPSTGRGALSDISPMACADVHRSGGGVVRFSVADRPHHGFREDMPMRASTAEQPTPAEKIHLGRLKAPDGGRDLRITPEQNRIIAKLEHPNASVYEFQPQQPEVMPPCPSLLLSEAELKQKCQSTINEYYSVMDLKEAALCVEELKATRYHPVMVSTWVSESLEKKEKDRDLLLKLLLHLSKCEPLLLTHEQFYEGMEGVLSHLVDTAVDVPKAPEFFGVLLGGLVSAGVFSLIEVNTLLKDGGAECGEILMEGYSLDIFGAVLDTLRNEKGEKLMLTAYRNSGIHVEDFVSPKIENKGVKLDVFLERRNLQALLPMLPLERHIHEALARKDPILDLVQWIEKNVPQSTTSDPSFLRMIMTQVLRHCLPNPIPSDFTALPVDTKTYVPLLRKFASGKARTAEGNQLQYIIAVQLFANEAGHPLGLMSKLFDNFYHDEVISEGAYTKWQDNVQDSTPGRDRAIREVGKWLAWLETAPEEVGED